MMIQEQGLGTTNKRKIQQKFKNKVQLKHKKNDEDKNDEDLGTMVVYYQYKKIQEQGLIKTQEKDNENLGTTAKYHQWKNMTKIQEQRPCTINIRKR